VTHDHSIACSLSIVWGIVPAFSVKKDLLMHMISDVLDQGIQRGVLDLEKTYILVAGDPVGTPGSTNLIRVLTGHEMRFFCTLKR
jgi:pyruvate kinase